VDPVNFVDPSGLLPQVCPPEVSGPECLASWGGGGGFNMNDRQSPTPISVSGGNSGLQTIGNRTFTWSIYDEENSVIYFFTLSPLKNDFLLTTSNTTADMLRDVMNNPRFSGSPTNINLRAPVNPLTPQMSEREKRSRDCFNVRLAEIESDRRAQRSHIGQRLLRNAAWGALRGAVAGGIAGAAGGGVLFGIGAVPGAILGIVVGGIFGTAGGVITGGVFGEPVARGLYDHFTYKGALEQARKYCDAQ
jgi:hypothetical protein